MIWGYKNLKLPFLKICLQAVTCLQAVLVYYFQHPETSLYYYFGRSKFSCQGCAIFFKSFNFVAEYFDHFQMFTKGATIRFISAGLVYFCCLQSNRFNYKTKKCLLIPRLEKKWSQFWALNMWMNFIMTHPHRYISQVSWIVLSFLARLDLTQNQKP